MMPTVVSTASQRYVEVSGRVSARSTLDAARSASTNPATVSGMPSSRTCWPPTLEPAAVSRYALRASTLAAANRGAPGLSTTQRLSGSAPRQTWNNRGNEDTPLRNRGDRPGGDAARGARPSARGGPRQEGHRPRHAAVRLEGTPRLRRQIARRRQGDADGRRCPLHDRTRGHLLQARSEEHTSELQS